MGRQLRRFAVAFFGGLLTIAPVWADDTEIFFGGTVAGVQPNLLFILDTSGSMRNTVPGTGKTRLENMQDAMEELLNNLNGVNVGLMRFSNPGGPVLFAVRDIDENVSATQTIASTSARVEDFDDDAQQVIGSTEYTSLLDIFQVLSATMIINEERLDLTETPVGGATVYTRTVQESWDDAEEELENNGNVIVTSGDLDITHRNGSSNNPYLVGVRFAGTQVPAGVIISNAYITFKVAGDGVANSDPTAEMTIVGEYGESAPFEDGAYNVSNRDRTIASVEWDLTSPGVDTIISTPNLTSVVQEIIDHPEWLGDGENISDMTFMIGHREASVSYANHELQTFDALDFRPTLTVEYFMGAEPVDKYTATGLRFSNVQVPRGATITAAQIDFTVAQTTSDTTNLVIVGELGANAQPFSDSNKVSGRTRTSSSVDWNDVETWDNPGDIKSTPDLSAIVQEIVDLSNWCGGDAMAFGIAGEGLRSAWARDADNGLQPVLRVSYDTDSIVPGDSCAQASTSKLVVGVDDDAEERGNNVWMNGNSLDLDRVDNHVGLRFQNINVPQGATISSAYIELTSRGDFAGDTTVYIEQELHDDSEPFDGNNDTIDGRSWSSPVSWGITETWVDDARYDTADISGLVQATVNRIGWVLGADMAFRLRQASGADRAADSFNANPVGAARLVINYEDDGTAASTARLVRDELLEQVDLLNNRGWTPVQDTLYEAALYYTGAEMAYGNRRGGPNDGGPHAYTRVSAEEALVDGTYQHRVPNGCDLDIDPNANVCRTETLDAFGNNNPTYETPIVDWCQKESHIILLTDGFANRPHSQSEIRDFVGLSTCDVQGLRGGEQCVEELASYLYTQDQSDLRETQIVRTHTIGFNFSNQWLADVAAAGGGLYKEADTAAELVAEVQAILSDVLKVNSSFVAPVAAINQFNRLNHRSEIYFAVFRPDETPNWPGNLKKYRLSADDNTVLDYSDEVGQPAIDENTGFFSDNAVSAWGSVVDGPEVHISGANSQVPGYDTRKVYTYYTGSTSETLSDLVNVVDVNNINLTKSMFNADSMSDTEFDQHLEWVLGRDVDDEDDDGSTMDNRYIIGDPLHSKPIAVTYGGTEQDPDITIFFGSNNGFLHAIDAETGEEQFSFLPEETMAGQMILREASTSQAHIYGIDSSVTPWVNDANADGEISGSGEFVRIFFGQRRGGRNYWGLDVTDRNNPKLLWRIQGGSGDFAELGQSWAQPILGTVNIGGTEVDVLYIAGGYDPDQDNAAMRATDDQGRAIYIVHAETGALLWKGGDGAGYTVDLDDMQYSIPATLSVVDVDNSGTDDMMFVGDMGGQLWRFDIRNGAAVDNLVTGGVIADLGVAGGTNSALENRRFYHSPDVSLVFEGKQLEVVVSIGSGYRAHPLAEQTQDRFYLVEQGSPFSPPNSYIKLITDDLYDATDNDVGEGVEGAAEALAAKEGWYFNLPNGGEKVLSTPLTFKNNITFTTYQPNPNAQTSRCLPSAGITRIYQVAVADARPINDWDDVVGLTETDRGTELETSSIIDEPVIVCTGAGCDMFVGAEKAPVDTPNTDRVVKTFWRKD
jgi:type IV pilus assembly protein PilY1